MQTMAASQRCHARTSPSGGSGGGAAPAVVTLRCLRPVPRCLARREHVTGGVGSIAGSVAVWPMLQRPNRSRRADLQAAVAAAVAAAAAAGGAADPPSQPAQPQPQPAAKPKKPRELSLQQRWRALKFAASETQQKVAQQLSQVPAVAALLQTLAALNQQLQPLYAAWRQLQQKREELLEVGLPKGSHRCAGARTHCPRTWHRYNDFLADETKRQWRWSKRYEKEMEWWSHVPPYMGFFFATVIYQAFMPVSFLAAVAVPLYYSWVLWDAWWASPIFVATLVMLPLKWVPWADMCLVWPGLI